MVKPCLNSLMSVMFSCDKVMLRTAVDSPEPQKGAGFNLPCHHQAKRRQIFLVIGFLVLLVLSSWSVAAKSYSDLYILISDAKTALQQDQPEEALALVQQLATSYARDEQNGSGAGAELTGAIEDVLADQNITEAELTLLSKHLLAVEEEQNPIDLATEKTKFTNKVFPALERLRQTVATSNDPDVLHRAFLTFNSIWTRNEALVRPEQGHYGRIETTLSFLRAAIVSEPLDKVAVTHQLDALEEALQSFVAGEDLSVSSAITSLKEGIDVLKQAQAAFSAGQVNQGQSHMRDFIAAWPTFEQAVSTRSASLYRQVESQAPVIMVKGQEARYQELLAEMITQLEGIDTRQAYSVWDSMLILLREGVEALLIVLSLVSLLRVAGQKRGLFWVYGGAGLGLLASAGVALALQQLFPALAAGTNREILEGWVGILAVVMMLTIGIWLHSKSKAAAWQAYLEDQMALVLSTGSFVSMFSLSFLAVFREGAETILFYAGLLPYISWQDFLLGIGLAVLVLIGLTVVFVRSSDRLPMHRVFQVLGWLIYALAFKMLGVSLHTLQLTNQLSSYHLTWLPAVDVLGVYPSVEVVVPQLCFIVLAGFALVYQRRRERVN